MVQTAQPSNSDTIPKGDEEMLKEIDKLRLELMNTTPPRGRYIED